MSEIETLAKGLTEAQKRAVLSAVELSDFLYGPNTFKVRGATISLCQQAIIRNREFRGLTGKVHRGYALTPLGLQVRDYLKAHP